MDHTNVPKESYGYNPHRLLDVLRQNHLLKNDADLARFLEVGAPIICKIRSHTLAVSGALLIRMHEATGLAIEDLRYLMGDRRRKFRLTGEKGGQATEKAAIKHADRPGSDDLVPQRANAVRAAPEGLAPQRANAVWPVPETPIPQSAKKYYKPTNRRW